MSLNNYSPIDSTSDVTAVSELDQTCNDNTFDYSSQNAFDISSSEYDEVVDDLAVLSVEGSYTDLPGAGDQNVSSESQGVKINREAINQAFASERERRLENRKKRQEREDLVAERLHQVSTPYRGAKTPKPRSTAKTVKTPALKTSEKKKKTKSKAKRWTQEKNRGQYKRKMEGLNRNEDEIDNEVEIGNDGFENEEEQNDTVNSTLGDPAETTAAFEKRYADIDKDISMQLAKIRDQQLQNPAPDLDLITEDTPAIEAKKIMQQHQAACTRERVRSDLEHQRERYLLK